MLDDYLEQLNSSDPRQRQAAVIALGKLRDPVALRPLAELFRTDPDAQIRELALKAGRLIRGDSSERPASTAPIFVPAMSKSAAASDEETPAKKRTPITQGAITSARQLTEDALSVNLRGDKSGAVKLLNKALLLNPTLIDDTYFRSVASAVL